MNLVQEIFLFCYVWFAFLFVLICLIEILLNILDIPKNYSNIRIFYFLEDMINKFKRD